MIVTKELSKMLNYLASTIYRTSTMVQGGRVAVNNHANL